MQQTRELLDLENQLVKLLSLDLDSFHQFLLF